MNPIPRTRVGLFANTATAASVCAVSEMSDMSTSTPCSSPAPLTVIRSGERSTRAPMRSRIADERDVALDRVAAEALRRRPARR